MGSLTRRLRAAGLGLAVLLLCLSSGCAPSEPDTPSLDDVKHRATQACMNTWLNHGVFSDDMIQDGLAQGFIHETPDDAALGFDFAKGPAFVHWASDIPLSRIEGGFDRGMVDPAAEGLPAQAGRTCLNTMLYSRLLPSELKADGVTRGYVIVTPDDPDGEFDFSVGAALYEWGESVQLAQIEQAVVDDME